MLNTRSFALALACSSLVAAVASRAGTLHENFSTDPALDGWREFGDTNLFLWDALNQNLRVTWDSSQTNSYFYHSLGTVLAKDDSFALEFDLRFSDIATNAKSGPFQIALGFLNFAEATRTNFWRGSGVDALHGPRSVAEFDYFTSGYYPGYGSVDPTISPTLISADNGFASGFTLLEMTNGALFHVAMAYSSADQTLRTAMTCNGAPFGPVGDVTLDASFTDFRLDTVAICSYSDVGDDYDSVLAHGVVDNLVITTPLSPVGSLAGGFSNGTWQVQFASRTNWLYTLERTQDFLSWTETSVATAGTGAPLTLTDTNAPLANAFYRVRAGRP